MFNQIKKKVADRMQYISQHELFMVDVDRDALFNAYIEALPLDEKQPHNCNCCKSFLRQYGNIVAIIDGKVQTLWDFAIEAPYDLVPNMLASLIKNAPIVDVFVSKQAQLGTDHNFQMKPEFTTPKKWEHFSVTLPSNKVYRGSESIESIMGVARSTKQVFKRSLNELTLDSVETVMELIAQNSLYRGEEHKAALVNFLKHKKAYAKSQDKDLYAWANYRQGGKIRNSAIGTLLIDLSENMDLDRAVSRFESVVAPSNYKRPTALVTKAMIESAEKDIKELGLEQSLYRRYATVDDIPVNDLLFVDRDIKKSSGLFDSLKDDVQVNPKTLSKVETVSIDTFINDIIPTATSLEVLLENKHKNFMSLVAPIYEDAPILFNWDNAISWSYQDGLADSMKDRVKAAGGKVEGDLRFSIQWNDDGDNNIDFDAHAREPDGHEIMFTNKGTKSRLTGMLDVDIINPSGKIAVENIIWDRTPFGITHLFVHNYSNSTSNSGFTAEIEYDGQIYSYSYGKKLRVGEKVTVAKIKITDNGLEFIESLDSNSTMLSKEVWNLSTNKFHKVSMVMLSPNYWGNKQYGNKHTFFILDKAINPDKPRGLFNEFLKPELLKHKRTFELLSSKMKVDDYDQQLSGLGFSSTQRAEFIVRVTGKFTRLIKVEL